MTRPRVLLGTIATAGVGVAAVVVARDPDLGLPEFLFGSVVLLVALAAVALVLRAARRASAERARAKSLLATAPSEAARRAVAVERRRLAADIQAVLRTSTTRIAASADEAFREWEADPAPALHAVQEEGERAGLELRRFLGLLRDEAADVDPPTPAVLHSRIPQGDVWLAVVVTLLAVTEHVAYGDVERPGISGNLASLLVTAAAASTILLRRSAPGLGAGLCGLVFALSALTAQVTSGFWVLATLGGLAWAAAQADHPRDAGGLLVLWGGVAVGMAVRDPENLPITLVLLGMATVSGFVVRTSEAWGRSARARADQRAQELDRVAAAAVAVERLTVARELHDVVSHAVGVMVMQAGAALATRDTAPDRARAALQVVRRTAATTLDELDGLVAVTAAGGVGAGEVPSAASGRDDGGELVALVHRMRAAGLTVRMDVRGAPTGELGGIVYRVVQESLTNVVRHAPGAAVAVHVHSAPEGVDVDIRDDGPGPGDQARPGYGLIGLAERVALAAGNFSAGPDPDGRGFRVHACLPASVGSPR